MNVSLKYVLTKMLSSLNGLIAFGAFSKGPIEFSTFYGTTTFDISKAGYTPICLTRVSLNQALFHCYAQGLDSNANTATIGVARGTGSGTITSLYIYITVLYIRSDFVAT